MEEEYNAEPSAEPERPSKKRKTLSVPVTVKEMRDGVVKKSVYERYCNEIIHFMNWVLDHDVDLALPWLTELGKETVKSTDKTIEGESKKERRARIKAVWLHCLPLAQTEPLIHVDRIDASAVMEYIASSANQRTGQQLSMDGYNGKRAAIFHLCRCHNGKGPEEEYLQQMNTLWKGFSRLTNRKRKRGPDNVEDNVAEEEDDSDDFKEGKVAMSPQLYRSVCKWLVDYGSKESIASACFICLTWNLACRSHNTAELQFSHMSWTKFDCMQINFRHTKTDAEGKDKRKQRNLYSNVNEYYVDFPFLLGLYLSFSFTMTSEQGGGYHLFPGSHQATTKRVRDTMHKILRLHEQEVIGMGYDKLDDIGLHSIRKGAASYLGSMPAGPSPVAICHRAGWSTGKVLDIYFQQLQSGDEFVGRSLSMLNFMSSDFAKSPAYFDMDVVSTEFINSCIAANFPCFYELQGMNRILKQCLASLVHHRNIVLNFEPNHPARHCISIFRNVQILETASNSIRVDNMWETTNHISGVPPHVKELTDLAELKEQLKTSAEELFNRIMESTKHYFETRRIGGGEITEERLKELIVEATATARAGMQQHFNELFRSFRIEQTGTGVAVEQTVNTITATSLPPNYQFPSQTILDVWTQWNVGNASRAVPPLKNLTSEDFSFIDEMPLSEGECRREKHLTESRRPTRKTFSDVKYICTHIEDLARLHHGFTEINNANMMMAFKAVTSSWKTQYFPSSPRFEQWKWRTLVRQIRNKVRRRNENELSNSPSQTQDPAKQNAPAGQIPHRQPAPVVTVNNPVIARANRRTSHTHTARRSATTSSRTRQTKTTSQTRSRRQSQRAVERADIVGPSFQEVFRDVPLQIEKTVTQALRDEELQTQLAIQAVEDLQGHERSDARTSSRNSGLFINNAQRGTRQNHGCNSLIERQQYSQLLDRAFTRREKGFCPIENCAFDNLVADHPCYNDTCSKFVHNLCAQGAGLTSDNNELNMYCSFACKNAKE